MDSVFDQKLYLHSLTEYFKTIQFKSLFFFIHRNEWMKNGNFLVLFIFFPRLWSRDRATMRRQLVALIFHVQHKETSGQNEQSLTHIDGTDYGVKSSMAYSICAFRLICSENWSSLHWSQLWFFQLDFQIKIVVFNFKIVFYLLSLSTPLNLYYSRSRLNLDPS